MKNIRKGKRIYLYAITSFVILACGVVAGCVRLDNHSDALKLEDNIEIVYGDSLYKKEIEGEVNSNNDTESLMCLVCDGGIFGENLEANQEIFVKNPSFKLKAGSESCYFRAKLNYWGLFDGELFSIENKEDYFDVTPVFSSQWLESEDGYFYYVNQEVKSWGEDNNFEMLKEVFSTKERDSYEIYAFQENSLSFMTVNDFNSKYSKIFVEFNIQAIPSLNQNDESLKTLDWDMRNVLARGLEVNFDLNGGRADFSNLNNLIEGERVNLSNYIPQKQGYTFDGWTIGNNKVGTNIVLGKENITLVALWKKNLYITYDLNGGNGKIEDENIYFQGDLANVTSNIPTKEDYVFLYWEYNNNKYSFSGNDSLNKVLVEEDITLRAIYTGRVSFVTDELNKPNFPTDLIIRNGSFTLPNEFPKTTRVADDGGVYNVYLKHFIINGEIYNLGELYKQDTNEPVEVEAVYESKLEITYLGYINSKEIIWGIWDRKDIEGNPIMEYSFPLPFINEKSYRLFWEKGEENDFQINSSQIKLDRDALLNDSIVLVSERRKGTKVKFVVEGELLETEIFAFPQDLIAFPIVSKGQTEIKWKNNVDDSIYQAAFTFKENWTNKDIVFTAILGYNYKITLKVDEFSTDKSHISNINISNKTFYTLPEKSEFINTPKNMVLCGWTYEDVFYNPGENIYVDKNAVVVAKWLFIEFNKGEKGEGENVYTVRLDEEGRLTVPENLFECNDELYEFDRWEVESKNEKFNCYPNDKIEYQEGLVFTALWKKIEYCISINLNGGYAKKLSDDLPEFDLKYFIPAKTYNFDLSLGGYDLRKVEGNTNYVISGFEVIADVEGATYEYLYNQFNFYMKNHLGEKVPFSCDVEIKIVWAEAKEYNIKFDLENGQSIIDKETKEIPQLKYLIDIDKNISEGNYFNFKMLDTSNLIVEDINHQAGYDWSIELFDEFGKKVSSISQGVVNYFEVPNLTARIVWTKQNKLEIRKGEIDGVEIIGESSLLKTYSKFKVNNEFNFYAPGYSVYNIRYYDEETNDEIPDIYNYAKPAYAVLEWINIGFDVGNNLHENDIKQLSSFVIDYSQFQLSLPALNEYDPNYSKISYDGYELVGWELDGIIYNNQNGRVYLDKVYKLSQDRKLLKSGEIYYLLQDNQTLPLNTELYENGVMRIYHFDYLKNQTITICYSKFGDIFSTATQNGEIWEIDQSSKIDGDLACFGKTFKAVWEKKVSAPEGECIVLGDKEWDSTLNKIKEAYFKTFNLENSILGSAVYNFKTPLGEGEIVGIENILASGIFQLVDPNGFYYVSEVDKILEVFLMYDFEQRLTVVDNNYYLWTSLEANGLSFLLIYKYSIDSDGYISNYEFSSAVAGQKDFMQISVSI